MSPPRRSELPDNLDPLVDTLSNVVGILVIVIALTQLELADALARVARQAVERVPEAASSEGDRAWSERRAGLLERADASELDRAISKIEARIAELESSAAGRAGEADEAPGAAEDVRSAENFERLGERFAGERAGFEASREADRHRRAYAGELKSVPAQLVARLPDPQNFEGREAWLLVRYGRVYPVDREALFERGRQAITRILPDGGTRALRPDEFDSAALYLRKHASGLGSVRWELETEPSLRVALRWRTRDGGIERTRLASDPGLRDWLAALRPERDVIRFQVWTDSFETYLEARTLVEAAGFHAGWQGHERDEDLVTALRFGERLPEVRPRAID